MQEDFTKNGETYDVILDAVGKQSFRRCRRSLKPGGIVRGHRRALHNLLWALWTRGSATRRSCSRSRGTRRRTSLLLKELIEAGEYRAVIDRTYPLEDVVEATRYVETGQKTGNVVLTIV